MGQRLNIELHIGDKNLVYANCYYHWSAYTISAMETVKMVVDNYKKIKNEYTDPFLLAVECFEIPDDTLRRNEETGQFEYKSVYAGLCESSSKMMKILYPGVEIHEGTDRNVGLIAIHPADVSSTRDWEEGRAEIYLDSEEVSLDIFCVYTKLDYFEDLVNYRELSEPDANREIDNIPELPERAMSLIYGQVKFDDIDFILEVMNASDVYKFGTGEDISIIEWFG